MQDQTQETDHVTLQPTSQMSRRTLLKAGVAALAAGGSLVSFENVSARLPLDDRPTPQSNEHLAALKGVPTTLIMDALSRLGHDRTKLAMNGNISSVFKTTGTIIGPAVTTKYEQTRAGATLDDIRKFVFKPVDSAAPGDIWVTESGTDETLSMFGDVIVLACAKKGLAGLVTDSGCRDIEAMEKIGLPVYATGPCLYGPGSEITPVAANVPVICGGVEIRPGDIVVADVNGVLAFPKEALADVVQKRMELEEKEQKTRQLIEQGQPLETAYIF
jgi:regulator of RNase E activity RraA